MIKLEDLYTCEPFDVPKEAMANMLRFLPKLQMVEQIYGKPLKVNRCFSTWAQHKAIYQSLNDKRLIAHQELIPTPIQSAHLTGDAGDLDDDSGNLKFLFFHDGEKILETIDLYAEMLSYTSNYIHLTQRPFKSYKPGGTRYFRPR